MSANWETESPIRPYRPLLPAPGRQPQASAQSAPEESWRSSLRENLTLVACERCRKRKIKCSGHRPSCWSCTKADESCIYDVAESETRLTALKRKHRVLEKDNADLQELLQSLRCRSESEAIAILRHLRSKRDPSSVLQHVKDSDVLLEASKGLLKENNYKYNDKTNEDPPDLHAPNRPKSAGARANERNLTLSNLEVASSYHTNDLSTLLNSSVVRTGERDLAASNGEPADSLNRMNDRLNEKSSSVWTTKSYSLQRSVEILEELYHHIQVMPEIRLLSVLQRIRSGSDPLSVLDFVQHGGTHIQQAPATSGVKDDYEEHELLDTVALQESHVKVPA